MGLKFDIDKHKADQDIRDRIRAVINGLVKIPSPTLSHHQRVLLEDTLARLQPVTCCNIVRLRIGADFHWDDKTHSTWADKVSCVFVMLRQCIINWWDYLLDGADESLGSDGVDLEDYLGELELYVEDGLDAYVIAGDERQGYWLMTKADYQESLEEVR